MAAEALTTIDDETLAKFRSAAEASRDLVSLGALAQYLSDIGQTEEAEERFKSALASVAAPPDTPWALRRAYAHYSGGLAVLCEAMGQVERAVTLYEHGLAAHPECPTCLGNYPLVLQAQQRPLDEIEEAYERALRVHPRLISVMLKYSLFLRHRRASVDRAEAILERALEFEPAHADVLATYAVFLHAVRSDDPRIEDLYARAAAADPRCVNTLSNFGLYYSEIARAHDKAKAKYDCALEIDPAHANTCYNYAVLLESTYDDVPAAVAMYERAIDAQPNHAYALYNLAVLMEEKIRDLHRAETLYRTAVAASPRDALANADLGRFLARRRIEAADANFDEAKHFLETALDVNYECATAHAALGEIALFLKEDVRAKACLRSALKADAKNNAATRLATKMRELEHLRLQRDNPLPR
ncbi:hypothetical protein CTAYLR_002911 [Chrysophaeum taylorii]|uniref:Tetratricopeptide repeat protein n=1 Tax=Chrysophaeum taylorii TaxID=2483200 RepID=A0AAD7XTN0_9STRA|nr:hypothetical protein CTAYLR_002911 [Chrysophaeum taylorii]